MPDNGFHDNHAFLTTRFYLACCICNVLLSASSELFYGCHEIGSGGRDFIAENAVILRFPQSCDATSQLMSFIVHSLMVTQKVHVIFFLWSDQHT